MKTSILLACLVVAATAAHASGPPPALLVNQLRSLAGESGTDCGVVPLDAPRDAAIRCARDASASGKPYRVVFELKGVETYTWQGAARDGQGRQWVVFYDADTESGANASPGLGQLFCKDVSFSPKKDEVIGCVPSTGGG
jgi:hypothetical protein